MIYNFLDDFCNKETTVYIYSKRKNEYGEEIEIPLSRPLKKDYKISDILCKFRLDFLFKDSLYGNNIKDITFKARSYSHGSTEYNDIKMHMPGYTWNGTVKKKEEIDYDTQEVYEKRCRRNPENISLNGFVCIEFDDVETKEVDNLIQKALSKFNHLIYAGRTLSNKLFCIHRADGDINKDNYINYFMYLSVLYYNELGIKADTACSDITRIRYMCDQFGARANMEYCDFKPEENIKIEFDKIFKTEKQQYTRRVSEYKREKDEKVYEYDEEKGFYYGHTKQHLHHIGELIVPVPSIEQMINTLIALGKTSDEIKDLWRDKLNYYNYNTKSSDIRDHIRLTDKISSDEREFKIGESTYTFILMFFPEITGNKSFFLDSNEFLCDRYYNMLKKSILDNNRILINGDTGIGKTHFANKLGEDSDVIVVVPYKAHMDNYPLYDKIELRDNIGEIKNGVIIWDRFVKLYHKGLINKDSLIIIDESHKLFLDQVYREAAILMNEILRKIKNHICYITATPINEIGVDKTFRFEKKRREVHIEHLKIIPSDEAYKITGNLTLEAILHLIYGNLNYYDHIFIASDRFAQKIYDRLYGRYDCQLIRANQKDSKEYIDLMKEQLLKHKIIIGTCISYESLNFNNRNEKIITISDMNEKTTSHTITQIAGRVRFSYNRVYLIETIQVVDKRDYKMDAEYYNKLEEIKNKYNLYTKKHYVQVYSDELEEISSWYLENNSIDKIKEDLPMYIKWEESEIKANNISDKSPLNEQTRNYIVDFIKNKDTRFDEADILLNNDEAYYTYIFLNEDNFINIKEDGQAGYIIRENIREQQYSYSKLLSYIDYKKINSLVTETYTLPKGLNGEILRIMEIIKLPEDKYNSYISEMENYLKGLYDIYYFSLERNIKEIKTIRKTYIKCFDTEEYRMYNNIFDVYKKKRLELYNRRINAAQKGGLKTKKCIITENFKNPEKYSLTVGQEFDSVTDLATYTNTNIQTISLWRKKKWIK